MIYPVVWRLGERYDHRGHCIAFEHETLGELGKVIVAFIENDITLMVTEFSKENPETSNEKQKVLEEVIAIIQAALISVPEQENT